MDEVAVKIAKIFEKRKDERVHWDNHWQEISDHSLGRRDFTSMQEPGRQRQVRIYDTTSQDANDLLGAALHSLLTNPSAEWFDIRFQEPWLNDDGLARRYLAAVHERLKIAFTRPESGFATAIAQVWEDLPGFGNACLYVDDDPGFGAKFIARPISEMYLDIDEAGKIVGLYRSFKLDAWQAVEEYGEKNLPPQIFEDSKKDSGGGEHEFIHHVRKRGMPLPGKMDATGMEWEAITLALKQKQVVRVGGFRSNPYMYGRWSVDTGETYGRGPGHRTLPNQKMLNAIWRAYIRGAEKAVDPPLLMENDSVIAGSQLRVTPNAVTVVQDTGSGRDPVRYLHNPANPNWSKDIMDSRTTVIQNAFHSEIIRAFMDPRMTATQVLEIAKLSQRQLSPMLGRNQEEILDPAIKRTLEIESNRTDFPQPPPELMGHPLSIEYVGPVARAQKAAEGQAILDSFSAIQAIAQSEPDVLDNFDADEAVRAIADGNGIPIKVIRLREDVLGIRRQRQEQQQQQAFDQAAVQGGETLAKLLPGIAKLNEQAGGALPN